MLGGELQAFMDVVEPSIAVRTDPQDVRRGSFGSSHCLFWFRIELTGNAASSTLGMYDPGSPVPELRQVIPSAAATGSRERAASREQIQCHNML